MPRSPSLASRWALPPRERQTLCLWVRSAGSTFRKRRDTFICLHGGVFAKCRLSRAGRRWWRWALRGQRVPRGLTVFNAGAACGPGEPVAFQSFTGMLCVSLHCFLSDVGTFSAKSAGQSLSTRLAWEQPGLRLCVCSQHTPAHENCGPGPRTRVTLSRSAPRLAGDYLGGEAYWAGGLHLYTPLPFRPGQGGFGELFRTHFFLNAGNLCNLNYGELGSWPLLRGGGLDV